MSIDSLHHYAVIVAGGSGTRLWPLSRKELPKQVQSLISDKTLLEDTVERIKPVVPIERIYISTSVAYVDKIRTLLPSIPHHNIIVEPMSRDKAAAFGLFSQMIAKKDPDAVIFSLASDDAVAEPAEFQKAVQGIFSYVDHHHDSIALLGITPTSPNTSLGYIKVDQKIQDSPLVYSVEKFVEKPTSIMAKRYVDSGEYYWGASYYCFKASILIAAYEEADPNIMHYVRRFIETKDPADYEKVPIKSQEIEIINARKFPLVVLPVTFRWSDIGSWGALHDVLVEFEEGSMVVDSKDRHIDVDSKNCMVVMKQDDKIVATVGLDNLVIIDTEDALLVLNKDRSQDIKTALQQLRERGLEQYL